MNTKTLFFISICIFITMFFMKGCISITNSGYDQAKTKQNGRIFTDVIDNQADTSAQVDTTGEELGAAMRATGTGGL